jgi:hypothetical protein
MLLIGGVAQRLENQKIAASGSAYRDAWSL